MNRCNQSKGLPSEIIGLIPAGGKGERIAPLPCSKELYPVGFQDAPDGFGLRPKVVSHYLLEKMRYAGVENIYIVLRKGKWDIPEYFGNGRGLQTNLAYLMMHLPYGVPYTLDGAYPFVRDSIVVFGFPDILFQPDDAFKALLGKLAESNAELVLGLFPAYQPQKMDMVDLQADGRIRGIQIKPIRTNLRYTWIIAVWRPTFTEFMHDLLIANEKKKDEKADETSTVKHSELFLGDVIQAAVKEGLSTESVIFTNGSYLDIGTPENLIQAVSRISIEVG